MHLSRQLSRHRHISPHKRFTTSRLLASCRCDANSAMLLPSAIGDDAANAFASLQASMMRSRAGRRSWRAALSSTAKQQLSVERRWPPVGHTQARVRSIVPQLGGQKCRRNNFGMTSLSYFAQRWAGGHYRVKSFSPREDADARGAFGRYAISPSLMVPRLQLDIISLSERRRRQLPIWAMGHHDDAADFQQLRWHAAPCQAMPSPRKRAEK